MSIYTTKVNCITVESIQSIIGNSFWFSVSASWTEENYPETLNQYHFVLLKNKVIDLLYAGGIKKYQHSELADLGIDFYCCIPLSQICLMAFDERFRSYDISDLQLSVGHDDLVISKSREHAEWRTKPVDVKGIHSLSNLSATSNSN